MGYTGKGWGPGDWYTAGRTRNPAGDEYIIVYDVTGRLIPRNGSLTEGDDIPDPADMVVDLLGGEITLTSEMGAGTTFVIVLPVEPSGRKS